MNIALKKIFFISVVSAIVLSFSVTSADVFSERSMYDTISSGSLPAQTEKINCSVTHLEPLPTKTEETQGKGIVIKYNPYIEQDENSFSIEPSGTIKPRPGLLEEAKKSKEEAKRLRTGLFSTELDIKCEENKVMASVSLNNISQEDLRLNFNVGGEFDFIVTDSEGKEEYNRLHGDKVGLPAISNHKLKKGEKLPFTYTWNYKDNDGNRISPGIYLITVKMLPMTNYKRNFSPLELTAVRDIDIN